MPVPVHYEVIATSIEEARAIVTASYSECTLRVKGNPEAFRFEYSRYDIGPVRFDRLAHTLRADHYLGPIGCLVVCRVLARTVEVDFSGHSSRFGRGDIFLAEHPERGHRCLVEGARLQLVGIDIPLAHEVAGGSGTAAQLLSRLRFGHRLPSGTARFWQRTVDYLARSLPADPAAAASPLVVGAASRMIAAALLMAASTESAPAAPADRRDAIPATLRRAVAFIEANPDLDITVADMARVARVTPRAVQLAFRRYLDTTPIAYLRRVRLDHARHDLRTAAPGDGTTVSTVAARWGYFNFSRFTAHYRATYDELPSQTLRGSGTRSGSARPGGCLRASLSGHDAGRSGTERSTRGRPLSLAVSDREAGRAGSALGSGQRSRWSRRPPDPWPAAGPPAAGEPCADAG